MKTLLYTENASFFQVAAVYWTNIYEVNIMQDCGVHNWSGVLLGCVIYTLLVGICMYLILSLSYFALT